MAPQLSKMLGLLLLFISGCSSGGDGSTTPPAASQGPQAYFSPLVWGETTGIANPAPAQGSSTYTLDDLAKTFDQSTYAINGRQQGAQVQFAGNFTSLARGLLNLGMTYSYDYPNGTNYNPPQKGNWAVELPNQGGSLVQLRGQPVVPLVAAQTCPSMTTAQTFQFVTLPAALTTATGNQTLTWNPRTETAYGSVDISVSADAVNFDNIHQVTLPPTGTPGAPASQPTSPLAGVCASTFYGNVTSVPGQLIITNPGNGQRVPPQAIVGLGPSGLLVESNGNGTPVGPPAYQNVLGAGTGAIGMPRPSSAVDTTALAGAQYLGFFYGSGSASVPNSWSSLVASFGFATLPTSCRSVVTPQTSTMIYGGEFNNNDPSVPATQTAGGYGKCDIAIDLGTQDPSNNGLYPSARVYVGTAYTGNILGSKYSFPAVAIAGKLNGKYAIFLIGVDTTGSPNQAWGIYLLQSN